MKGEAVVRVAVRLLAIWIFVSSASGLAGVAALDRSSLGYGVVAGMTTAGVATEIIAAALLWKYAAWVACRIADGLPAEGALGSQGRVTMTRAAVGVLGVVMLSSAIPESLWYCAAFVGSKLAGPSPQAGQPAYDAQMGLYTIGGIANAAAVLTRLVIGGLLVFKSGMVSEAVLAAGDSEVEGGRPTRG